MCLLVVELEEIFIYILDTSPLSDVFYEDLLPVRGLPFHSPSFFPRARFSLKKKKSNVSIFTFIDYALAVSSFLSIFSLRCLKLIMCKLIFLEGTFKL